MSNVSYRARTKYRLEGGKNTKQNYTYHIEHHPSQHDQTPPGALASYVISPFLLVCSIIHQDE